MWVFFNNPPYIQQGFGDTKGVIRIRKSKKDRQTTTQCPPPQKTTSDLPKINYTEN